MTGESDIISGGGCQTSWTSNMTKGTKITWIPTKILKIPGQIHIKVAANLNNEKINRVSPYVEVQEQRDKDVICEGWALMSSPLLRVSPSGPQIPNLSFSVDPEVFARLALSRPFLKVASPECLHPLLRSSDVNVYLYFLVCGSRPSERVTSMCWELTD